MVMTNGSRGSAHSGDMVGQEKAVAICPSLGDRALADPPSAADAEGARRVEGGSRSVSLRWAGLGWAAGPGCPAVSMRQPRQRRGQR